MMAGDNLGWTNQTVVHPLGLIALLITLGFILFAKRSNVLTAVLLFICVIPSAQRITIVSLDFTFVRLLILAGLLRRPRRRMPRAAGRVCA